MSAYNYKIYSQNSLTGEVFDITTLAGEVQHSTFINGQPGKLTVTLQQDPKGLLALATGSILTFIVNGNGIFYGYVFEFSANETGEHKIIAYDQLRYLKNKEVYITSDMTASSIFQRVCTDNLPSSKTEVIVPSSYVVPTYLHEGKTLYEIIEYGLQHTNVSEGKQYFIKDDYGTLKFTELAQEKTNLILGDKSLLSGYDYKMSIDNDTFNRVKMYRNNEESGKRDVWMVFDGETERQWGKLQKLVKASDDYNEAQIRELAQNYLKLHNRETKTMKLTAVGIPELVAGSGFTLMLERLAINQAMWAVSATHTYSKDDHVMKLEVAI